MLNNFKKILKTIGTDPSLEQTFVDTSGATSRLSSDTKYIQKIVNLYGTYGPSVSIQSAWDYPYIVLGTNGQAVSTGDYYIVPLKTTYPSISSWFSGTKVTTTRTHNSDGSLTTHFKLAFIGSATYNISEIGLYISGYTVMGNKSTNILIDRATFPTIQVTNGKSVVIDYKVTTHIALNVPTE